MRVLAAEGRVDVGDVRGPRDVLPRPAVSGAAAGPVLIVPPTTDRCSVTPGGCAGEVCSTPATIRSRNIS